MQACCFTDWISQRGENSRTEQQIKDKTEIRREENHVSILKSFIVLQKSNYYLTRKKDKWQIIYITNARPAHTVAPFYMAFKRPVHR